MAVTFVIGRAGSGKTHRCFTSIVSALRQDPLGPPIYWLLPRQATFDAERALACGSGLPGFSRAWVVSFVQLGRDISQDCGAASVPEVTPVGRQMILGHLLRRLEPELRFYRGVARQAGLAALLDLAFAEWERAGHESADFASLVQRLNEPAGADSAQRGPTLSRKMHDLTLLYDAYLHYLGQERLDQHRRTAQVLEMLDRCSLLRQARIYVDGFAAFTAHERKLLAGVARAGAEMEICLLVDPRSPAVDDVETVPDEMSLFHRTERTFQRLMHAFREVGADIKPIVRLETVHRFENPALQQLERGFCCESRAGCDDAAGVTLIEAANRQAEVDAVARTIQDLLVPAPAGPGMRYRDIALLTRDLEPYKGTITDSFAEHGIPFFADQRRSGVHHPLLKSLRAMIQIARFNWRHDAVMSLLKAGLVGVSAYDADGIENYVLAHGLFGAAAWETQDAWAYRNANTGAGHAIAINGLRESLLLRLQTFLDLVRGSETLTLRSIATEIFATFDRFRARQTLATWIDEARAAGDLEQAAEHEQVWAELTDTFEQMVALLGDERVSLEEFEIILSTGLQKFDLALTPPRVDQVLVGQIDRTRSPELKVCFVLGLNEGEFPAPAREGAILSDRERQTLQAHQLQLDPDVRRKVLDERLLGYIALTRASQRLYLSRPAADDASKPAAPSAFWRETLALLPTAAQITVGADYHDDPAAVATPRQLVTSLMNWVRRQTGPAPADLKAGDAAPWPALYQWLARQPCNEEPVDFARYRGWRALSASNTAELSAAFRDKLLPRELEVSVRQLETFAACPFRHFAHEVMRLRPRQKQEFGFGALGRVYHQILAGLFDEALRRNLSWDESRPPIDAEMIRAGARQVAQKLRNELMLGTARSQYLMRRAERMVGAFIERQFRLMQRGRFRPAVTSTGFGGSGKLPALELATPGGARVKVQGHLDRVDIAEESGHVVVFDYKLAVQPLWFDGAYQGVALQLLTSLLAVQTSGEQIAGRTLTAAAGFYLPVLRRIETVKHPADASNPAEDAFWLDPKPRGIFSAEDLPSIDRSVSVGQSEAIHAFIKKDGTLGKNSDSAEPEEFAALLNHVRTRISLSADQMLSGNVSIAPYRIGAKSPCASCEYQDICRFHPTTNRYRKFQPLGRVGVLNTLTGREAPAES